MTKEQEAIAIQALAKDGRRMDKFFNAFFSPLGAPMDYEDDPADVLTPEERALATEYVTERALKERQKT